MALPCRFTGLTGVATRDLGSIDHVSIANDNAMDDHETRREVSLAADTY